MFQLTQKLILVCPVFLKFWSLSSCFSVPLQAVHRDANSSSSLKEVLFCGLEREMAVGFPSVGLSEAHPLCPVQSHAVQSEICLVSLFQYYNSSCLVEKYMNYVENRHIMW